MASSCVCLTFQNTTALCTLIPELRNYGTSHLGGQTNFNLTRNRLGCLPGTGSDNGPSFSAHNNETIRMQMQMQAVLCEQANFQMCDPCAPCITWIFFTIAVTA